MDHKIPSLCPPILRPPPTANPLHITKLSPLTIIPLPPLNKIKQNIYNHLKQQITNKNVRKQAEKHEHDEPAFNGWQLAKMKKSIPDMSLP